MLTWYDYNIIVISFLTSSLLGNQFTEEGETQLREATEETVTLALLSLIFMILCLLGNFMVK